MLGVSESITIAVVSVVVAPVVAADGLSIDYVLSGGCCDVPDVISIIISIIEVSEVIIIYEVVVAHIIRPDAVETVIGYPVSGDCVVAVSFVEYDPAIYLV